MSAKFSSQAEARREASMRTREVKRRRSSSRVARHLPEGTGAYARSFARVCAATDWRDTQSVSPCAQASRTSATCSPSSGSTTDGRNWRVSGVRRPRWRIRSVCLLCAGRARAGFAETQKSCTLPCAQASRTSATCSPSSGSTTDGRNRRVSGVRRPRWRIRSVCLLCAGRARAGFAETQKSCTLPCGEERPRRKRKRGDIRVQPGDDIARSAMPSPCCGTLELRFCGMPEVVCEEDYAAPSSGRSTYVRPLSRLRGHLLSTGAWRVVEPLVDEQLVEGKTPQYIISEVRCSEFGSVPVAITAHQGVAFVGRAKRRQSLAPQRVRHSGR